MKLSIPELLVSLVAAGMAVAFLSADRRSRTSQALALGLLCVGVSIFLNSSFFVASGSVPPGWFALPESLAMMAVLEWLLRVRGTIPAGDLDTRGGDQLLRIGQGAALLYGVLSMAFPEQRAHQFLHAGDDPEHLLRGGFWLFATPILVAAFAGLAATKLLFNRKPDRAEAIRILSMSLAVPFFMAGFVVPTQMIAVTVMLGEMVFLIGAVQYHVQQGQRGQFMSRFLSQQVAELVRARGLDGAMRQNYLEITVVVADLRGFTAYAVSHPSSRVIEVLREYYEAVGQVAAQYGATIKDFAGDGALILVGAPIPMPNHAITGLALARQLRDAARAVTRRWSAAEHQLGIGIGVASGFVTVGVIGAASRLEYTAVGPAVNLASRLCEQAQDGEILVAERTRELAADQTLQARAPVNVKGFAHAVALYSVS